MSVCPILLVGLTFPLPRYFVLNFTFYPSDSSFSLINSKCHQICVRKYKNNPSSFTLIGVMSSSCCREHWRISRWSDLSRTFLIQILDPPKRFFFALFTCPPLTPVTRMTFCLSPILPDNHHNYEPQKLQTSSDTEDNCVVLKIPGVKTICKGFLPKLLGRDQGGGGAKVRRHLLQNGV